MCVFLKEPPFCYTACSIDLRMLRMFECKFWNELATWGTLLSFCVVFCVLFRILILSFYLLVFCFFSFSAFLWVNCLKIMYSFCRNWRSLSFFHCMEDTCRCPMCLIMCVCVCVFECVWVFACVCVCFSILIWKAPVFCGWRQSRQFS